jgi:hypothetical protein
MDADHEQCRTGRLVGQSGEQIGNQITQISQLAEQIQNQIRIYQSMLQNTLTLPSHVWGQVEGDLNRLRSLVTQGQGIAFSMGNADDVRQRFQSFSDSSRPRKWRDLLGKLPAMVDTNRHDCSTPARPASHRSNSHPKKRPWAARSMSKRSRQMQALRSPDRRPAGGAGPEVAGPRLAANHHDGRWLQSEQAPRISGTEPARGVLQFKRAVNVRPAARRWSRAGEPFVCSDYCRGEARLFR